MIYKALGLMSGSSLDGIDIVLADLEENGGTWSFRILNSICYPYEEEIKIQLKNSTLLNALDYQLLHTSYGHYLGKKINQFINQNNLEHTIHFIACHGHTTFHLPAQKMTHQLGDGAAIAAETALPVITDLRSLDVALGGQGAPIVPIGEMLLFPDFNCFLNIGGIANISFRENNSFTAFDICPANKVLNMLAEEIGKVYDKGGELASGGIVNTKLLDELNKLDYYKKSHPKSLANSFGIEIIYPLIGSYNLSPEDSLATFIQHIVFQIKEAIVKTTSKNIQTGKLFISGGGAYNTFLISRLSKILLEIGVEVYLPSEEVINYKEALIIALMGALRWREQNNVMRSVTGSSRNNIGGALWLGSEG